MNCIALKAQIRQEAILAGERVPRRAIFSVFWRNAGFGDRNLPRGENWNSSLRSRERPTSETLTVPNASNT